MKMSIKGLFICGAIICLIGLLIIASACSSTGTPTSLPMEPTRTSQSSVTPQPNYAPPQSASGTLTGITDSVLTLSTAQGQIIVTVDASTTVKQTVDGILADIVVGDELNVTVTSDNSEDYIADTITVLPARQKDVSSQPPMPPSDMGKIPDSTNNISGSTMVNKSPEHRISGTVTVIEGYTLTLATVQGEVIVVTHDSTSVKKIVTASLADLKVGAPITVFGTWNGNNSVVATSIII